MLHALRHKIAYKGRHFTPTWRYVFNLKSTLAYRKTAHPLSAEAQRVVGALSQDGVAVTSAAQLLNGNNLFDELRTAVEQLEVDWTDKLATERQQAQSYDPKRKTFILQMLGTKPTLDPTSIYARFALQPAILELANAYFEMYTQLRFYNVWHTLRTEAAPRESQLWHRDRDDHRILKLFVYLSDIDSSAGALTYATGTHTNGQRRANPEFSMEGTVKRTTDEQMARVVPATQWLTAAGTEGTLVFADTSGFHKGGLARSRDRLQYVCMFTSPTAQVEELFQRPAQLDLPDDLTQRFALQKKTSFI